MEAEEALAAEAEAPEPEPEPETEPEPEPEPEPPAVDVKALEKVVAGHERAMRKVLGDGMDDMKVCPTCDGFAFVSLDHEPELPILHSPDTERCPGCNGYGQRFSGAVEPGQVLIPCTQCSSGGYITKPIQMAPPTSVAGYDVPQAGVSPTPVPAGVDPALVAQLRAQGLIIIDTSQPTT